MKKKSAFSRYNKSPVVLTILDGWGQAPPSSGNAVEKANTPTLNYLKEKYSSVLCDASGTAVGLPEGQMGNSEVGHMNIGAGRVVYQDLTRIDKAIEDGNFLKNKIIQKAFENVLEHGSSLHLMGLASYGGVHSSLNHLKALVTMAQQTGIENVYIHAFLDGRDVLPRAGENDLKDLDAFLKQKNAGQIATICGRYYAMDRDKRWERTKIAYDALVMGRGKFVTETCDWLSVLKKSYEKNITDEFVRPIVVSKPEEDAQKTRIHDFDTVVFFNFRPDRARQLTYALTEKSFDCFDREKPVFPYFVCMTQYDENIDLPIAYPPEKIKNSLGEIISRAGLRQLRIAETEKYAHVTFFFSGGIESPFKNEKRILIPSPKVATYDLQPEMSAFSMTQTLLSEIDKNEFDVIICNFANMDMVGHTGIIPAAVAAVESVDTCLGKIYEKVIQKNGVLLVTADHGNAECLIDPKNGGPFTSHTINPVMLICADRTGRFCLDKKKRGRLSDIAPTVLEIMNLDQPAEMTGKSLLKTTEKQTKNK